MSDALFALGVLGYGVMYALPHVFFRRDTKRRFNFMWWMVALPFTAAPIALVLSFLGKMPLVLDASSSAAHVLQVIAVPFLVGSIALVAATVASHRVPLALWHQPDDAPRTLVTHGPYKVVRHPFYVSFVLLLVGSALLSPDLVSLVSLVSGISALWTTAAREEQRLLASEFGGEYAAYKARTGRFLPRLTA